MKKNNILYFIVCFLVLSNSLISQDWNFKLNGKVELRNWKLSNKAMKSGTFVNKASVELRNASGVISQSESDSEGNFALNIPHNGEFTLTISSPGQNSKKFLVTTKGVSSNNNDANFRPSINIAGMISTKHLKDMNYLGLDQSLVTIENNSTKNLIPRTTMNDGEYKLIQKFCTANKLGDMALEKKNYSLAKTFYAMAMDIIEGEPYPKEQLKKAEDGLKLEKALENKKQRTKKTKIKSAITNQKSTSSSSKKSSSKNSVETGKPVRKTRKVLGK